METRNESTPLPNDGSGQPGISAQFGIAVVPPGVPGNEDFHQLFFTADHPTLAAKLSQLGVNARYTPRLAYEINNETTLTVDVPMPHKFAFTLSGPITQPDPLAPPTPTSVFNYYARTKHYGNVLQRNVVQGIRCPVGTFGARGLITDNSPVVAPLMRLTLVSPAFGVVTTQAPQEGVSPVVTNAGGAGAYAAIVSKTAAGSEAYTTRVDCITAAGAILPAAGPVQTQNQ